LKLIDGFEKKLRQKDTKLYSPTRTRLEKNKGLLILKTAVGREKAVQAIDVHREWTHCVVTFSVMSRFVHFLGASRDCADFRDPTAVFRLMKAV